ncbi:MAG: ABC transporter substrate-binding protein [Firmicutes bacterium]|jgi:NitT/TauT family transport system substrate-binding protein|nr:ABC transporter substrate-binding protein [Bacillota bacterium]
MALKMWKTAVLTVALAVLIATCGLPAVSAGPSRIRIADQFGLGYAPVTIMTELRLLEKHYPGLKVERRILGSGGPVREAMVAGQIDVGFMGIPHYLIGYSKGIDFKITAGLTIMPLLLLTYRTDIRSIRDFKPTDKIGMPGPGSNQHMLLSMASEIEFGNPTALDANVVAMPHPDAAALLGAKRELAAHYSSPPYQFETLKREGFHVVANGNDAFGEPFTFLVCVTTGRFVKEHPDIYDALVRALGEAVELLRDRPHEAARILATVDKSVTEESYYCYITWEGVEWATTPRGIMRWATFMKKSGYIDKIPNHWTDTVWDNLKGANGS